jgi:hypothetical protein
VYVDHTGQPSAEQLAWAAVLRYWPAALCDRTVVGPDPGLRLVTDAPLHVLVHRDRRVSPLPGVRLHRSTYFDEIVLTNLSPPRVRLEHAVLEVASSAPSERAAVAVLAQACQSRRTTAARLLAHLDRLPRLKRRRLLRAILADVASGAFSVLERLYLRDVERAHGLPTGIRQRRVRHAGTVAHRDVEYRAHGLVVELDGRLGHEAVRDRWADLDRDVHTAVAQSMTVRLGYGQVLQPCRVAAALAGILQARGWRGAPRACGPTCPLAGISGDFQAPGAGEPPRTA